MYMDEYKKVNINPIREVLFKGFKVLVFPCISLFIVLIGYGVVRDLP